MIALKKVVRKRERGKRKMSKKVWYGNLTNRLEEGRNFTGREIAVGDDITEYLWSDRHCYYTELDEKHLSCFTEREQEQ